MTSPKIHKGFTNKNRIYTKRISRDDIDTLFCVQAKLHQRQDYRRNLGLQIMGNAQWVKAPNNEKRFSKDDLDLIFIQPKAFEIALNHQPEEEKSKDIIFARHSARLSEITKRLSQTDLNWPTSIQRKEEIRRQSELLETNANIMTAELLMGDERLQKLKEMFDFIDKNGNKEICWSEASKFDFFLDPGCNSTVADDVKLLFKHADEDNNGAIDECEWIDVWIRSVLRNKTTKHIDAFIDAFNDTLEQQNDSQEIEEDDDEMTN